MLKREISVKGPIRSLAVSADSKLIATGTGDRTIYIWHADTGERAYKIKHEPMDWEDYSKVCVQCLEFRKVGDLLVSGS